MCVCGGGRGGEVHVTCMPTNTDNRDLRVVYVYKMFMVVFGLAVITHVRLMMVMRSFQNS